MRRAPGSREVWQERWSRSATLAPQPVLGSNGTVYFLQGSALQRHAYDQPGQTVATGSGFNATSNLVLDGANNIYFWDNGYLIGLNANGDALFERQNMTVLQKRDGDLPQQFIRLMVSPDGSLWSNNKNGNSLYVFKPRFKAAVVSLTQQDIRTETVYRANDRLLVGGVAVRDNASVVFQAQNGISFARGFSVQRGSSVLARTGF
jgi:outer membrane protein assembly factor BamB